MSIGLLLNDSTDSTHNMTLLYNSETDVMLHILVTDYTNTL